MIEQEGENPFLPRCEHTRRQVLRSQSCRTTFPPRCLQRNCVPAHKTRAHPEPLSHSSVCWCGDQIFRKKSWAGIWINSSPLRASFNQTSGCTCQEQRVFSREFPIDSTQTRAWRACSSELNLPSFKKQRFLVFPCCRLHIFPRHVCMRCSKTCAKTKLQRPEGGNRFCSTPSKLHSARFLLLCVGKGQLTIKISCEHQMQHLRSRENRHCSSAQRT